MKRAWTSFPSLFALLALTISLAACGGGGSGLVDDLGTDTNKGAAFTTVRYNDAGNADSALNRTIGLRTETSGDTTVVSIAVNDVLEMYGVTLDLNYDAGKYSPESVEFSGLIATPIEMSITRVSGLVALGQVDTTGKAMRDGDFATITFRNEPNRTVSQAVAFFSAIDVAEYAPDALTVAGPVGWDVTVGGAADADTFIAYALFAQGDGNSDGMTNISDLTPLSSYGFWEMLIDDTHFERACVDYNGDGMTNISDLATIGQHFLEFCDTIEIWLTDSAVFDDSGTAYATLAWVADSTWGDPAPLPPAAGTTDWSIVFRNWAGNVAAVDKQAADADTDGTVYLYARAVNPTENGPATAAVALTAAIDLGDFVIQDMTVSIGGADYLAGDTVTAEANAELALDVTGIWGLYQAVAFVPGDAGGSVPQTEYDDALAIVAGAVGWSAQNAGHADMRRTDNVLTVVDHTATVFPDDDPESDAATPEGELTATLPEISTGATAGNVVVSVDVDVIYDPTAPLIKDITTSAGPDNGDWMIDPLLPTTIFYFFDMPGGVLADPSAVVAELYDFTDGATAYTFTYTPDPVAANGEFGITENLGLESTHILEALLGAGEATPGHEYALRIHETEYASVNESGAFLVTAPLPPPVDFVQIPTDTIYNSNHDHMWLFYPEPKMLRNPRAIWVVSIPFTGIQPDDEFGYEDVIKIPGNEFWFAENGTHPRVTVVKDAVPSAIGPFDEPEPGVFTLYRCPGYLVVDIGMLTFVDLGTEDYDFGYRVFALTDGGALGGGTFSVEHMPQAAFDPQGFDWGINIFDDLMEGRGYNDMANRSYDNHILNGDTVTLTGEGAPDVLYVEYMGGDANTFPLDAGYGTWGNNMRINFHSDAASADWQVPWDPRAVTAGGHVIAVHAFIAQDFDKPGDVTYGHFDAPQTDWQIQLTNAVGQVKFDFGDTLADVMSVMGSNPND